MKSGTNKVNPTYFEINEVAQSWENLLNESNETDLSYLGDDQSVKKWYVQQG